MESIDPGADSGQGKISAICGMIAPIAFASAIIIAGALRPGYDHAMQYISALGEGGDASAYVMNFGGFFLLGVLLLIFSLGFFKRIDFKSMSQKFQYAEVLRIIIPMMIGISGVGYMLTAFSPGDTAPYLHGFMGFFAGFIFFLPLITAYSFIRDPAWKSYWLFSFIVFIAQAFVGIALRLASGEMIGLEQRAMYVPILIWVEIVAFRSYRISASGV